MIDDSRARDVFLALAQRIYPQIDAASLRVVEDPAVAVPGFHAFELRPARPVRGWANDQVCVMARKHNFGPALDALGFRDEARRPPLDALVHRLIWLHGAPFTRADAVAAGELGAAEAIDLTPRLEHRPGGALLLTFGLRDPGGPSWPASVVQYEIAAHPSGGYTVETRQVAPPVSARGGRD